MWGNTIYDRKKNKAQKIVIIFYELWISIWNVIKYYYYYSRFSE